MLDTLSPEYYLQRQAREDADRIATERKAAQDAHTNRVWNALIPACSVASVIVKNVGVKYLHPTKGWRMVGKKRFAIRGVY